ncbi:hypothetical protein G7Y89_g6320 [Cudoniella acicularis]|uniref:Uncharacterized protein n=1 Tax=Cudoniella acicularis TaxID=354080 RepID=A0A8H4W5M5_9HELO|nr:hypothetical protein G7Y89_g6320 [Cudoniella acicularis]
MNKSCMMAEVQYSAPTGLSDTNKHLSDFHRINAPHPEMLHLDFLTSRDRKEHREGRVSLRYVEEEDLPPFPKLHTLTLSSVSFSNEPIHYTPLLLYTPTPPFFKVSNMLHLTTLNLHNCTEWPNVLQDFVDEGKPAQISTFELVVDASRMKETEGSLDPIIDYYGLVKFLWFCTALKDVRIVITEPEGTAPIDIWHVIRNLVVDALGRQKQTLKCLALHHRIVVEMSEKRSDGLNGLGCFADLAFETKKTELEFVGASSAGVLAGDGEECGCLETRLRSKEGFGRRSGESLDDLKAELRYRLDEMLKIREEVESKGPCAWTENYPPESAKLTSQHPLISENRTTSPSQPSIAKSYTSASQAPINLATTTNKITNYLSLPNLNPQALFALSQTTSSLQNLPLNTSASSSTSTLTPSNHPNAVPFLPPILAFAAPLFSTSPSPSPSRSINPQILALGDFSHHNRFKNSQILLIRDPKRQRGFRRISESGSRNDGEFWAMLDKNWGMLEACAAEGVMSDWRDQYNF